MSPLAFLVVIALTLIALFVCFTGLFLALKEIEREMEWRFGKIRSDVRVAKTRQDHLESRLSSLADSNTQTVGQPVA